MKPRSAVRKGKRYEDYVGSIFHMALSKYEDYNNLVKTFHDLKVKRDRDSGNRPDSYGDIFAPFPWFPYSIECKHHKDLNFTIDQILKGKIAKLRKIFQEHVEYARKRGKIPVVVFRANRTSDFVCISREYWNSVDPKGCDRVIFVDDLVIISLSDFIRYFPMRREELDEPRE